MTFKTHYTMLSIATIGRVTTSIGNFGVPPLMPFLRRDLQLNHVQIGLLVSTFFVGAIVSTTLAGWLVDTRGVKPSLLLGQLIMGCFLIIVSQASSFSFTLSLLFLAGLGQGFVTPATTKAVMEWAPVDNRATVMGILMAGVPIGAALAAAILPRLASVWNWQLALTSIGIMILGSAILTYQGYKDAAPNARTQLGARHYIRHLRLVLSQSQVLLLTAASILLIIVQTAFMAYLVLFMTEYLKWGVSLAGLCLALAHLGGACGRVGWGWMSDRLLGGDRRTVLGLIILLSAGAVFALSFVSAQDPPWFLILIVIIFGISGLGWAGIHLTSNAEGVDQQLTGTATSLGISLILIGVIGGPLIFGLLVDLSGSYHFAWQSMAVIAVTAIIPLLRISRHRSI